MAENIAKIAQILAQIACNDCLKLAAALSVLCLGQIYLEMQATLHHKLEKNRRECTNPDWVLNPNVPMSEATFKKLSRLAENASAGEKAISPLQLAAEILEVALANCSDD